MKLLLGIIFITFLMRVPISFAEQLGDIVFIVNIDNPVTEISVKDIKDYYFKRKRKWPNGDSIRFIDQNLEANIRNIFVKTILKKTNSEVELFWIGQKLYTGDSAPLRMTSDRSIIEFVSIFKGAIGYVASESALSETKVKVIKTVKD